MLIAIFFEARLQWNRRNYVEPLCSVTIFSTASFMQLCIFRMEVEHELRSVECSYICHIWLYMYV